MKNEKDLSKLSDSELDDLIMQGIQHQENHFKHTEEYQHGLNIVAAAKEEKAGRESGERKSKGADIPAIAENVKDDKVQDVSGGKTTEVKSAKGKAGSTDHDPVAPKPVVDDGTQIPAENINQGLPGVEPAMAETTPENVPHVGKDKKA